MAPFWKRKSSTPANRQAPVSGPAGPSSVSRSIPIRPKTTEENPFQQRGDELFNQGDYSNAAFMYSEAIRKDANQPTLFMQLCLAQTMSTPPKLDEALESVNTAIQLNPTNGQAWKLKGDIYLRKNDLKQAEETYMQCVGILEGYEKVQAQQSLAEVRSRQLNPSNVRSTPPQTLPSAHISPFPVTTQPVIQPTIQPVLQPAPQSPVHTLLQAPTQTAVTSQANPVSAAPISNARQRTPSINVQATSSPIRPALSSSNASNPLPAQSGASTSSTLSPASSMPPRTATPNREHQHDLLAEQLNIPVEAPPTYTPSPPVLSTTLGASSPQASQSLQTSLSLKRQGALYVRPLTAEGQIDTVILLFQGKNFTQSLLLDIPPRTTPHPSWRKYHVDTVSHPGTNFIDYDCETASSYDGYHLGTTSVIGYTEEYREYQVTAKIPLTFTLEAATYPPVMELSSIVSRLQLLFTSPALEDNRKLEEILGLPMALNGTTRSAISDICMCFHRGQYEAPTRFIDFLASESFSKHIFDTTGIGLTNFLFHILLGAELLIRLRKLGSREKYPSIMKTTTSALVVISGLWMEHVIIRQSVGTRYTLVPRNHALHTEALLRFAEAIEWPYMEETRRNVEMLYSKLLTNTADVHNYLKDWIYGLVLPGKFFRHRILSCLVLVCPSTKHLGFAPFYTSGLIVAGKSYWPKRTAVGRVLGGLQTAKSTCGWIGPLPAPAGSSPAWVSINARRVNFVAPVVDDYRQSDLDILGFSDMEAALDPDAVVREIFDLNKWNPPTCLPARTRTKSQVQLKTLQLSQLFSTTVTGTNEHRVKLEFDSHGKPAIFTLFTNPVFVHVPKCTGPAHPMHERMTQKLFKSLVLAKDLKNGAVIPTGESLVIIDATQPDEEAMARAWCAETGRHAIVRKGGIGCFACATNLATRRTGLAFNVFIWCS